MFSTSLFEEDDWSLEVAFDAFGSVKNIKKQTYVSGTRLVYVALSGTLPRHLMVEGFFVRLW